MILKKDFFNRPTLTVARDLIGKYLVRKIGKKIVAYMITETEAYDGPKDFACHARSGRTARNASMFEEAGTTYVYFTYGMHWMLNLVCGRKDYPAAVLVRALATEITPLQTQVCKDVLYLDGPGKLTKKLKIDKKLDGKKLGRETGLWIEDRGVHVPSSRIQRTPRIGVAYAGSYAKKPWRFVLKAGARAGGA